MLVLTLFIMSVSRAAEQLTSDAIEQEWGIKNGTTSQGRIIWTDGSDVFAYENGSGASVQQRNDTPGFESLGGPVDTGTVFAMGSGAAPGQVIAAWRRGANGDYAWIWNNTGGGPVVVVNPANPFSPGTRHNPEGVSIADGHVFMVLQAFSGGNAVKHLFEVDAATGATTNLTGVAAVHGVSRVASSGGQAAWVFDPNDFTNPTVLPLELRFFDGAATTTVDTGDLFFKVSLSHGRLVYAKTVAGVSQVFLYDATLPNPASAQITTDASGENVFPLTDGRHIAWLHGDLDGTHRNIVLYGGVTLTQSESKPVDSANLGAFRDQPFQLQRGQLLWNDQFGTLRYDDGRSPTRDGQFTTSAVDIIPATAFSGANCCIPWLADGVMVWVAQSNDGGFDAEVFRSMGTTPVDTSQPAPPILVLATPGDGTVTLVWDYIIGATAYNVYRAAEPGVTKDNYASLLGGTRTTVADASALVTGLANNVTYYFVVTAVAGATEGGNSREASATPFGAVWQAGTGAPLEPFFAAAADPTDATRAYAGHTSGVYVSADGGATWTSPTGASVGKNVHAVAAHGAKVFAATTIDELLRSTDHGSAWTVVASSPIAVGETNKSLAIDPANPSIIYAGDFHLASMEGSDSLLIKSIDGGANWSHLPQAPGLGDDLRAYAFVLTSPGVVYAGGSGTPNLAMSVNGGGAWAAAALPNPNLVYALAANPADAATLYAGTLTNGAYRSTDSGATWTPCVTGFSLPTIGVRALVVDPAKPQVLYSGTDDGVYYSPDAGEHWVARNAGIPAKTLPTVYALALTPGRRLMAATSIGLYRLDLSIQNHPPSLTNPGPQTNVEGDTVSLQLSAADLDGDTPVYGATGLPPGPTVDSATGLISGTVSPGSAGSYLVTVTAADTATIDSESFTWTISIANHRPEIAPIPDQHGREGDVVSLPVSATDADHDTLAIDATGLPPNASIDTTTGLISGTLAASSAGIYSVTVTASDGHLAADALFTWTIAGPAGDVNGDSVVNAIDVQVVINEALGIPTGNDADVNCDNTVNAVDVQLVINAVLGLPVSVCPAR